MDFYIDQGYQGKLSLPYCNTTIEQEKVEKILKVLENISNLNLEDLFILDKLGSKGYNDDIKLVF